VNSVVKKEIIHLTLHAASLHHHNYQLSIINYQLNQKLSTKKTMEQKSLWSKILNILITVLTAIATTFTTTSCIDML
jgi:hypothetical protein